MLSDWGKSTGDYCNVGVLDSFLNSTLTHFLHSYSVVTSVKVTCRLRTLQNGSVGGWSFMILNVNLPVS